MKRHIIMILTALAVGISTGLLGGVAVGQQSMSDYASTPPFVFQAATPNILLLMDNSQSMSAYVHNISGVFSPSTTYAGYLDSTSCYDYEAGTSNFAFANSGRFAFKSRRAAVGDACPSDQWDGNLLNWMTFKRMDALKKAMIGGVCTTTRLSDGTCPPTGIPAKVSLHHDKTPANEKYRMHRIIPVAGSKGSYVGRIPDAITQNAESLWLYWTQNQYRFCIDDSEATVKACGFGYWQSVPNGAPYDVLEPGYPAGTDFNKCVEKVEGFCVRYEDVPYPAKAPYLRSQQDYNDQWVSDTDPFIERNFAFQWVDPDPKGAIQQVGAKARLGMMVFKEVGGDGGKVVVPIGSREVTGGGSFAGVPPKDTNTAAMVVAAEMIVPLTQTPLAEALYEAVRYVAQIPSTYGGGYETAFQNPLGGANTCPAGYGYSANACVRDPYFHASPWGPGAVVPCCQTFIILVTDGAPALDENIPPSLKEYAAAVHGQQCTGGDPAIHLPNGVCNTNNATPAAILLQEHKTDYRYAGHHLDDVALWAHTVDLRQTIIPGINEPGHDLLGMQNVSLYTFYAFGDIRGRELLMQAARQGGFVDIQPGDLKPDGAGKEWDKVINATGLLPTGLTRVNGCNADCIPDNYFESSNVNDLTERLLATLFSILRTSSSGTSVAAQTTSTSGQGAAYQAYFFPSTAGSGTAGEVTWTGYTQGLFVDQFGNLREDTDGDGKLVLSQDLIIKLRFDDTAQPPKTVVDKYAVDGTGAAGARVATGVELAAIKPIWEAGRQLALTNPNDRKIFTWADLNNNGILKEDNKEWLEFKSNNGFARKLCPFLGGATVADCAVNGPAETAAVDEARGIIDFMLGEQVPGLRDRQVQVTDDNGDPVTKVWKLGDVMHATPVVVGAPRDRYDVIYGDTTYAEYFIKYKDRRQVVYVGANDGMLHAFNAGFFVPNDNPATPTREELMFCTKADCKNGAAPKLGAELWAYIPQDVLPQLRWLTRPDYTHVYYVDLKPKVTDVRIFCSGDANSPENCITGQATAHPNGWGTILIGGFRMGGSCANCPATRGGPRVVTATFDDTTQTRVFLSSYFVLDITDPEKDPVLLWTFRDQDLGFTTAAPAVFRVNEVGGPSSLSEKWYVVFGTGPTHYDGTSTQFAQIFTVDLKLGPAYSSGVNRIIGVGRGRACSSTSPCIVVDTGPGASAQLFSPATPIVGFMGDAVTVDFNLDYRMDVVYAGSISCAGATPSPCNGSNPIWKGAMWRLTLNGGDSNRDSWGFAAGLGARAITALISTFGASSLPVGPVVAAPAITTDGDNNLWVYFGTGRFFAKEDSITTDLQRFFGIKDIVVSQGDPDQTQQRNNLIDVSNIELCTNCAADGNVSTNDGVNFNEAFTGPGSLLDDVKNVDGWFVTLNEVSRERTLSAPVVFGGFVFFASYSPPEDTCGQGGSSRLYALYYLSGTGTPQAVLGTTTDAQGRKIALRSVGIGLGVAQVAINYGGTGTGAPGLENPNQPGQGCGSGTGFSAGMSHGEIVGGCLGGGPAGGLSPVWSRITTWRDI